jgi:hypothetical protein
MKMDMEQAFEKIAKKLQVARDSGTKPSIRASGTDWVCTLEDKDTKFNIIAKEGELMMVSMESEETAPNIERTNAPGVTQQELIQHIQNAIAEVYDA